MIGAGLLGASLGLAVKQRRLARRVIGVAPADFPPAVADLEIARGRDAFDDALVGFDARLAEVDFLVACTPVDRIAGHLAAALEFLPPDAVVTDVGSTKHNIVSELRAVSPHFRRYVGSHPMAGSERSGPEAASAQLFAGRTCLVAPADATPKEIFERIKLFWMQLGMTVVKCSPERHDAAVARTSHLPHLTAAATAAVVGVEDRPFVGAGFRDTTRVAGGHPALWTAILRNNRTQVLEALGALQQQLDALEDALRRDDADALCRWLEHAKRERDALGY